MYTYTVVRQMLIGLFTHAPGGRKAGESTVLDCMTSGAQFEHAAPLDKPHFKRPTVSQSVCNVTHTKSPMTSNADGLYKPP